MRRIVLKRVLDEKEERTNLEGDDEASWCPFIHHWFQDFGDLIHLDM